jgi:hypothetical protein
MCGGRGGGSLGPMLHSIPFSRIRPTRILLPALAALAVLPAAAGAATIGYEGDALVLRAAPGEANDITLSGEDAPRLSISDGTTYTFPADRCEQSDPQYAIRCDLPASATVRLELGDGDDRLVVNHTVPKGLVVVADGGAGRDDLKAIDDAARNTFSGGDGDDVLRSEGGGDTLRGGAGNDQLLGNGGADVLEGGDGSDKLTGDACGTPAADVLDGGAGYDTLTDWGDCGPGSDRRPVTVTVDGVADDGRPGEGDDVRDLDHLQLYVPATVIGGDGAEAVEVWAPGDTGSSRIEGRGGADDLRSGNGAEVLDGGAGNDRVEGGYGHDTLTGGPGRDELHGDSTAAQCGGNGQSCTLPFGNDVIQARDGEVDEVDCGPGEDRVVADATDVVASDCETVERSGGATGGGTGGGGPAGGGTPDGGAGPATAAMRVTAPGRLQRALRDGLVVRLTGARRGALTVTARLGRKTVAVGRVTVGSGGTATARVRFTPAARRALAKRRSVRLTVKAGALSRSITIKR